MTGEERRAAFRDRLRARLPEIAAVADMADSEASATGISHGEAAELRRVAAAARQFWTEIGRL